MIPIPTVGRLINCYKLSRKCFGDTYQGFKKFLFFDQISPFLGFNHEEIIRNTNKDLCSRILISELFITIKKLEKLKLLNTREINKLCNVYTVGCFNY